MSVAFLTGSPADWAIIAVVALIIFGPQRMPELGKQLGKAMREFRKISEELTGAADSMRTEVESVYKPILTPPALDTVTSSPTVERAASRRTYDQDPEDLMAPAVTTPTETPKTGLTLSTLPSSDHEAGSTDVKGH